MLIDRKNKEIRRLNGAMKRAETGVVESENRIQQTSIRYKMENTEREQRLARARKATETATRKRVALVKALKRATGSVEVIKSDISRNLETLEAYRTYHEFLQALLPEGKTIKEFFVSPNVVVDELDAQERSCYYIIDRSQNFDDHIDRATTSLSVDIAETNRSIDDVNESYEQILRKNDVLDKDYTFTGGKQVEKLDGELGKLTDLVRQLVQRCFGGNSDVSPTAMLEKFETTLEKFYAVSDRIDPALIAEKQAVKLRERREEQRRHKQEKQEQDQQRKREQAMARATKPIAKRNGRPLIARSGVIRREKGDRGEALALKKEQEAMDRMLYGSPYDDD
jgi:hypothetical protein